MIEENPKNTAADPAGMSSFFANKYLNMRLPLQLK
jgi:hypothetical protein